MACGGGAVARAVEVGGTSVGFGHGGLVLILSLGFGMGLPLLLREYTWFDCLGKTGDFWLRGTSGIRLYCV